jgi:predicted dehydrogenase
MKDLRLNRRQFLARSVCGTAAALSLPTWIPASALGRDGATSPSDRMVMGCIGVGGQGTRGMAGGIWAPEGGFIGRPEIQVVAVCDVNRNNRENARNLVNQKYSNKDCATYVDYHELIARPDIDLLLIATGDRWHPLVSIAAAKAGKDVYCEKPVSVTIEEAIAVRKAVARYGTVMQVGTQQRSSQAFRFACELVRNGYIGQLQHVTVGVGGPPGQKTCSLPAQPVPDWLDYDRWLGPAPWRPFNGAYIGGWMGYRDFSGGEMTNWGAHHFDIAQWGVGADRSGPVEIIPPDGKEFKVITYRYANGVVMVRDPERLQREAGVDNGVMFTGSTGKVAVWRYTLRTWPENLAQVKIKPNEIHLRECDNHHTDFLNAVKSRGQPGSSIAVASRSITVCHLGNIAYELGRPLKWNPAAETFVNDPEADRLISRPMRSPYHL